MLSTLILAAMLQAPKPKAVAPNRAPAGTSAAPSLERERALNTTLRRKWELRAQADRNRLAKRKLEAQRAKEWQEYVERVGPVIAAQQREAFYVEMEARRTAAMQAMGSAALQDAATNRARLRFQAQQAGAPQMYLPGSGPIPVPYPYSPLGVP